MANIKQQAKRNLTNEKKRLQNASFKSSLKTAIKKFEMAVKEGKVEEANNAYSIAFKKLDKAQSKGIYHKNKVARNKSRLSLMLNEIA